MPRDMYETLGIPKTASEADITKAIALARSTTPTETRRQGSRQSSGDSERLRRERYHKQTNYDKFGSPDGAKGGFSGFGGYSGGTGGIRRT